MVFGQGPTKALGGVALLEGSPPRTLVSILGHVVPGKRPLETLSRTRSRNWESGGVSTQGRLAPRRRSGHQGAVCTTGPNTTRFLTCTIKSRLVSIRSNW